MHPANRAILLTPPGSAAIAVIRLVGPAVGGFLSEHFSRPPTPGRAVHGQLTDGTAILDDPVVVVGPDGGFADISVHGGPWIVRSTLDLAARAGFEVVENAPGPLPLDAVDGDTLLDREILASVPLASTELALRVLLSQGLAWRRFCQRLSSGEDVSEEIDRILCDRSLFWLLHPPRVAIVGTANVGKSTLANQLFAQKRSITADLPGTTRDWVGEIANLDGLAVMLVDTPGLRQTDDPIERQAIVHAEREIQRADLVLVVLDATEPQPVLADRRPGELLVVNKCDRPSEWDIGPLGAIGVSALTGDGVEELRSVIRGHFGCEGMDPSQPRWWTNRQREIVDRAQKNRASREVLAVTSRTWQCPDR